MSSAGNGNTSKGIQRNHRAGALLRRMKAEFGEGFDPVIEALKTVREHTLDADGRVREPEYDENGNRTYDPDLSLFVQTHMQAASFVFPKLKAVEVDAGDRLQEMVIAMRGLNPKDGSEHEKVVYDITPRIAGEKR
jgi:hypothetical protein